MSQESRATAVQALIDEVEEFVGWWGLNREGSVNRTYDHIDELTKRLAALLLREGQEPDWIVKCPKCNRTVLNHGDLCSQCAGLREGPNDQIQGTSVRAGELQSDGAARAVSAVGTSDLVARAAVRDAVAGCFGDSAWERQTWRIVSEAIDSIGGIRDHGFPANPVFDQPPAGLREGPPQEP